MATTGPAIGLAVQLRLSLAAECQYHRLLGHEGAGVKPCERDAQVRVSDPVRGQQATCCTTHGLRVVGAWRESVPNRRKNAPRVTLAWLPGAQRRIGVAPVIGARRRRRAAA